MAHTDHPRGNPVVHHEFTFQPSSDVAKHLCLKSTHAKVSYSNPAAQHSTDIFTAAKLEPVEQGAWKVVVTMVPNPAGHPDDVATLWLMKGELGKVRGRVELGRVWCGEDVMRLYREMQVS